MSERGDPRAVRVGPGKLYVAAEGATEPEDLVTAWSGAWTLLGYTQEGSEFVFEQEFEDVFVAEELDPILTLQTTRRVLVNFNAAQITAANMQRALNGGTITTDEGVTKFEPPGVGDYTHIAIGWEAEDSLERWIFRKCLQIGSVNIARRKSPDLATLPMSFSAVKPATGTTFVMYHADDYEGIES